MKKVSSFKVLVVVLIVLLQFNIESGGAQEMLKISKPRTIIITHTPGSKKERFQRDCPSGSSQSNRKTNEIEKIY